MSPFPATFVYIIIVVGPPLKQYEDLVFLFCVVLCPIGWMEVFPPASKLSAGSLSRLPATAWGLPVSPATSPSGNPNQSFNLKVRQLILFLFTLSVVYFNLLVILHS